MLLTPILVVPALAGLLCLVVRSRRTMEALNILAFGATLGLGVRLFRDVLARGIATEWGDFFYADALSAWMVLLISIVSLEVTLATSLPIFS
jgi:formate hydrogenlyase subunit 3/multisubunit Na+/H+ antiporter MnhD subunit